jgi:prepilin-type N-terminal cleavage/methylation domain-containing protein
MRSFQKGFTLIELLVVIGIVGILLSITLVAINPARQFRLANDTSRSSHINNLSSAITQLIIDNKGSLPSANAAGFSYDISFISTAGTYRRLSGNATTHSAMTSLCMMLTGIASVGSAATSPKSVYLSKLPVDPTTGSWTSCTTFDTGYSLMVSSGRVWMSAQGEEPAVTIEISR